MPRRCFADQLGVLFVSLVSLCGLGCHRLVINAPNVATNAPLVDPSVYTVTEYLADKYEYDSATKPDALNLAAAKIKRDEIAYGLMTDVDIVYGKHYGRLFGGKNITTVVSDGITLGLGAAGSIASNVATKTIFAALSTAFSGLNLSVSKNYYAEQSFQIIGIAMQTRRDKVRAAIIAGLSQEVTAYPLNLAKRDLIAYGNAGTLAAGLQELQEEAGVATAAVKIPATVIPTAPAAVYVDSGILQNALTWSPVSGATEYNVYYSNSSGVTKTSSKLASATVAHAIQTNLDASKTVYYAVTASNDAGESPLSPEVFNQPIAAPTADAIGLPAPANLRVQIMDGVAVITFDAPVGAASFNVYKDATSTATTTDLLAGGETANLYTDPSSDASTHYYSVVAVDRRGHQGTQSAAIGSIAGSAVIPTHKLLLFSQH